MSTADLTHEALSAALSADKPLTGEQRAVLVSMIAQEKRQTHYLDGEVARLTRERDSLRAELDALKRQEPVARVGGTYQLMWAGSEPLADLLKRHPGVKVGSFLFAAPTPAAADAEALRDALRYQWLRAEHERFDPLCHLVWKRNKDRNCGEWVNTANLDAAIDAALAADAGRAKTEGGNDA